MINDEIIENWNSLAGNDWYALDQYESVKGLITRIYVGDREQVQRLNSTYSLGIPKNGIDAAEEDDRFIFYRALEITPEEAYRWFETRSARNHENCPEVFHPEK